MVESYQIDQEYNSLCLVSSAACNLQCKYCEIAKSYNYGHSHDLQDKIKKAFEDGSFLLNTVNSYRVLKQDTSKVTFLNFWGQEPTLTLDSFRTHIKDWFEAFPNINRTFFSTNGGTDATIIYNYIRDVDTTVDHYIQIYIQYSYDGEWSCRNERGIDPNVIKENVYKLITLLNDTQLRKTQVFLCVHGVINFNLVYHLLESNEVDEYLIDFDKFIIHASNLIRNPKCRMAPVALNLQQPYHASQDDGMVLANFLEKSVRTEFKYKFQYGNPIRHFFQTIMGRLNHFQELFDNYNWTQYLIDAFNSTEDYHPALMGSTCGAFRSELKCMYDGTLMACQNFIFDLDKKYINDESKLARAAKENVLDNHLFI